MNSSRRSCGSAGRTRPVLEARRSLARRRCRALLGGDRPLPEEHDVGEIGARHDGVADEGARAEHGDQAPDGARLVSRAPRRKRPATRIARRTSGDSSAACSGSEDVRIASSSAVDELRVALAREPAEHAVRATREPQEVLGDVRVAEVLFDERREVGRRPAPARRAARVKRCGARGVSGRSDFKRSRDRAARDASARASGASPAAYPRTRARASSSVGIGGQIVRLDAGAPLDGVLGAAEKQISVGDVAALRDR